MPLRLLLLLFAASPLGCGDNSAPLFLDVTVLTNAVSTIGPYEILVTVNDDTFIKKVELRYRIDDEEELQIQNMESLGGDVFRGAIPGQPVGTTVRYQIVAEDEEGSHASSPSDENTTHILQVKARE